MNILLFGATGMIGHGVLLECLRDDGIAQVLVIGRQSTGLSHSKLREVVQPDVTRLASVEDLLTGIDACFFCLGVSSLGVSEEEYTRLTYHLTLEVAGTLVQRNPNMTFVYVSGTGTDSTAKGRLMWARVKGRTENALLALPFRAAYMFRPGFVQPIGGVRSKTAWVQAAYTLTAPLTPLLKRLAPGSIATSQEMGRAMIAVAKHGFEKRVLENRDITRAAASAR